MTKEVLVRVRGIQSEETDSDTIELITPGTYYQRNGKHYILYDEAIEDVDIVTHNRVQASPDKIEVFKRGAVETHMVFETGKKSMANYLTPIGLIVLGLTTESINIEEEENAIHVSIRYALEMNGEQVASCSLGIDVHSKQEGALHLNQTKE